MQGRNGDVDIENRLVDTGWDEWRENCETDTCTPQVKHSQWGFAV